MFFEDLSLQNDAGLFVNIAPLPNRISSGEMNDSDHLEVFAVNPPNGEQSFRVMSGFTVPREPTPSQISSLAMAPDPIAGITLFSFGVQSKSSIPRRSQPRRKGNGEPHANTYVATSVRSIHATGDE